MKTHITIRCPKCSYLCNAEVEHDWEYKIVYCPSDDGGCDSYFAIRVHFQPVIQTFELKEDH